jgi:hypothetical protein
MRQFDRRKHAHLFLCPQLIRGFVSQRAKLQPAAYTGLTTLGRCARRLEKRQRRAGYADGSKPIARVPKTFRLPGPRNPITAFFGLSQNACSETTYFRNTRGAHGTLRRVHRFVCADDTEAIEQAKHLLMATTSSFVSSTAQNYLGIGQRRSRLARPCRGRV